MQPHFSPTVGVSTRSLALLRAPIARAKSFKTFAIYAGAVICFGGLIFAGIRMMSGRFQDAIPGLFGALFGAGVLG
jgi:hypothetical protein